MSCLDQKKVAKVLASNITMKLKCQTKKEGPSKFAWLNRMFSCRQINRRTLKKQDITSVPDLNQKSTSPCKHLSLCGTSNSRFGNGPTTVRGQFARSSVSPADRDKLSTNIASTRYRSKRKHRLFRPNKVGAVTEKHTVTRIGLHRARAVQDLSVFVTSNSRQESTSSKTNRSRSRPAVLLTALFGTFAQCLRREGHGKGKPHSSSTSPPYTINDDEQAVSSTTTALPQYLGGELAGCYRPTTVKSEKTTPAVASQMFRVGSGGENSDNCTYGRATMGQVVLRPRDETQDCKRRKTVANKQTSVDAADLHRTAVELQLGQNIKPNVIKLPAITSSDAQQDHPLPYPTINEKDLRRANKEGRPLVLGRGQSGVVRLMRYHRPDGGSSLVAVKRLISRSSSGTQAALTREIGAMLDVEQCPIFPRVVGIINRQSFAQEYIGNPKSLATLSVTKALRGRPQISLLNWILIITDVIEGLLALHQSGWAHCDLQTNNVLLWKDWSREEATARWEARIIDLGNAKWMESSQCLSLSVTEKEAYYRDCRHIPAEVVEGQAPYGIASDIYSLGVLMRDVASRVTSLADILPLADQCTTQDYQLRPSLKLFLKDLDVWCYDHTGCNISQLKSQIITYV